MSAAPEPIRVTMSRSGGLLPTADLQISVSTADLDPPDDAELVSRVAAAGVEQLAARSPIRSRGADMYDYELTVEQAGERHRVDVSGAALPEDLRPLVRWLEQRAAAERRRGAAE